MKTDTDEENMSNVRELTLSLTMEKDTLKDNHLILQILIIHFKLRT